MSSIIGTSPLFDFFDKIHVIGLPYKADRRERLSANLRETGVADPDSVNWYRAISGDMCWAPAYFQAGNGPWGCLQSHLRIVQDAIMDGLESILILEDDVVFHSRAGEILKRVFAELPDDWGQLYLGGQHLKRPEEVPGAPFLLRGVNVNRTHAYALHRRAFARFQQHVAHAPDYIEHGAWHIDHQLGIAHERRDWNVYCPSWWPCGQNDGSSNVSGNTNPRLWWQPWIYSAHLPFIHLASDAGATETERVRPYLHFGNNPKPGTREDLGLDGCVGNPQALHGWLSMIAREAMDMGLLPGIQHPAILAADIRAIWTSGCHESAAANLASMIDYPFNGLFPHSLNDDGLKSVASDRRAFGSSAA